MNIMFVCHGNICRSPMGEYILKDLAQREGLTGHTIASSAVSREEIGNPVYPPARRELAKHGISCDGHHARQLTRAEYDAYDLFLVMDSSNLILLSRIFPDDPDHKIHRLLEFAGRPKDDVEDPWYTRDFSAAYEDILSGCKGVLDVMRNG
ncbi:MAG: low molecular weight phosphotyrosine protein phosphatase [Oscillospiraceae bacterium]|nr:low molecular weight phosphotyrosine protein phosphatase [Oscillospiraceae bacterium]